MSQAQAPALPLTRRELREAERRAQIGTPTAAAPLVYASRRERREAERAQTATPSVLLTRTAPVVRAARPVAPAVVTDAPELPAVVIPAGVATATPELPSMAELHERPVTERVELPQSFRRNEAALKPVTVARRGSNRAFVRLKRGAGGAMAGDRRSGLVRSAAGITALGFAATVAVATTLPAAAEHQSQQAVDAMIGDAGGAQTLTVGSSSDVSVVSASAGVDRAPSYAVATMGNATNYNMTFGVPRPDPNTYSNNLTASVQWPFPVGVVISSTYGPRVSPCAGCSSDHKGVDFTPGEGTPIGSIAAGTVVHVQTVDQGGLGVHAIVEHVINGQKVRSVYGHMLVGSIPFQVGDTVQVGDEVGRVGNTGSSTGAHLHLEIHIGDEKIDPFAFLAAHNIPETVVDRPAVPVQA